MTSLVGSVALGSAAVDVTGVRSIDDGFDVLHHRLFFDGIQRPYALLLCLQRWQAEFTRKTASGDKVLSVAVMRPTAEAASRKSSVWMR